MVLHEAGAGVRGTPALRFREVEFRYAEEAPPALSGVDLHVNPGEILALVGRNGSGKSTLARLANGLLRPQHGCVRVGEHDTGNDHDLRLIRAAVGIVFQDPDCQIVGSCVGDDVAFGLENLGVPRTDMKIKVAAALEAVGLPGMQSVPVGQLSGGERQRLAIAGLLVLEPRVLIVDEPTSMLDRPTRIHVRDLVLALAARGTAVLWITQHMEEVLWANRLIALEGGRVAYDGVPAAFFLDGWAERLGLDRPPAARLAHRLGLQARAGEELCHVLTEEELVSVLRGEYDV